MNECEILKWALNPNTPPPQIEPAAVDADRLLSLVAHHRLTGRLLERVRRECPQWCGRTLLFSLWKQQEQAKNMWRAQVAAANELSAAFSTADEPLVFIKGFSHYALTGDESAIRFSGDLDLLFSDPERFQQTLREAGHPEGKPAFSHEFATLFYKGHMVELHRFFPVWSYPPEMTAAAVLPDENPGRWVQPFSHQSLKEVQYEDFKQNSSRGVTPETQNLFVPSVALTVLILCAHEFKEFIESPFTLRAIKLAAVAEVYELARHAQFDAARFLALADQFQGHDAVAFMGYLLEAYYSSNPLPQTVTRPRFDRHTGFPQGMNFFGCWACLHSADDLLLPINMFRVISSMRASRVVAAATGSHEKIYSVPSQGSAEAPLRAIVQTTHNAPVPLQVAVTWGMECLSLNVFLSEPLTEEPSSYFVQVFFFDREITFHVVEIHHRGTGMEQGGSAQVSFEPWQGGYKVAFSFPWDAVPERVRESMPLPALLFVSKWSDRDDPLFKGADPVLCVPLHIVRQ